MKHHVLLTGEIGSGKSTALKRTLALLDLCVQGLQTYYPQARGEEERELYLRAWGDTEQGVFLTRLPGCNLAQTARVFDEAVELDGIVLTKLDGTAKGGFVFSLSAELSLPVIFAGVGEKMDDLEAFDSREFVNAIL